MSETDTLARLLRACATGYGRRLAISPEGLGNLTRQKLWHQAVEAILGLDTVHWRSKECFLDTWVTPPPGSFCGSLDHMDEDLVVAFLRKVMPPYHGCDMILFRGQPLSVPIGRSWSAIPRIALMYGLYGHFLPVGGEQARADAVLLQAIVPAANIICAPALRMKADGEYIVDIRGVEFSIQPALEAVEWIHEHVTDASRRASAAAERWTAKRLAAEQPERVTESSNGQRNEFRTAPTNWGDVEAALTDRPSGHAEESRPAPESNTARLLAQPVSSPDGLQRLAGESLRAG